MLILVLSVGNVSKARSAASRQLPMGNPRLALAGVATMMMTMMTCLFPAEGEVPTIHLPEQAQVPGQPSPLGTSTTRNTHLSNHSWCRLICHTDNCLHLSMCIVMIYCSHLYDTWIYFAHLCSWGGCMLSCASFLHITITCQ
jgi:hypothetical protein